MDRLAWSSRGDDVFHAASTMKIPVMIELFHQVREGKVKLSDPLPDQERIPQFGRRLASSR